MTPQFRKKHLFADSDRIFKSHKKKSETLSDSPEVLYTHYFEKIEFLKTQLSKLNLLEHPCEIQSVCNSIILATKKLNTIATKYKIQRHTPQPGHSIR